jgi:hypothetical protein
MVKYTGGGFGGSLPGIPARDLNDNEIDQYGGADQLVATGLYVCEGDELPKVDPNIEHGVIDLRDGVNNEEATLAGKALAAKKRKEQSS